jgi:hypothetical protein
MTTLWRSVYADGTCVAATPATASLPAGEEPGNVDLTPAIEGDGSVDLGDLVYMYDKVGLALRSAVRFWRATGPWADRHAFEVFGDGRPEVAGDRGRRAARRPGQ